MAADFRKAEKEEVMKVSELIECLQTLGPDSHLVIANNGDIKLADGRDGIFSLWSFTDAVKDYMEHGNPMQFFESQQSSKTGPASSSESGH